MKKEKQVRSYKRRTKSGKTITVKAHTAKYEAADKKAKEVSKKEGAGKELEEHKKKPVQLEIPFDKEEEKKVLSEVKETAKKSEKPTKGKTTKKVRPVGSGTNGPIPKKSEKKVTKVITKTTTKPTTSAPAFTAAEFKEWYRGTGSASDKKVAKALRAQLGRAGYRKLEDEAIDGYSARGHLSMFKRVSGGSSSSAKTKSVDAPTKATSKAGYDKQGYKKRSVGTGTKTSAQLKKEYEDAVINERKSALASSRKENKDLYNKYNTSYREVSSFMSKSKRKWQWNRYRNAFESTRMPNGEGMRGIARMSLKDAIKKMQKSAKK